MNKIICLCAVCLLLNIHTAEAQTRQQWRDSVEVLNRELRQHPDDVHLRLLKAQRHYAEAKADYDAFLAIEPLHFEARLGLAHVLQKMGKKKDVVDELNHIVQMFPDSADAYAARALNEMELQQWDVALYDWDEAIRLKPARALNEMELQQWDVALYDWDEAIRLKPDNEGFVISKVDVLLHLGRRGEAKSCLDQLVRQGTPRGSLKDWYDRCK